jgi:glutamate-1-semialdehyde 2,1-aminomutase
MPFRSHKNADAMYARAQRSIAGGVSSDARRAAGTPLFVDRARGAELWDVDGNRVLDYVLGQGPNILGHASPVVAQAVRDQVARGVAYAAQHELECVVAERLCRMVPGAEKVRFNTVGSEAVHGALRLARGITGRSKVVKFEGNYHGWLDPVLYSVHPDVRAAGDPARPATVPGSAGLTPRSGDDLIVLPYNDLAAVRGCFERHPDEIAAVICEPLLCNTGVISPVPGFLEGLRELTAAAGALLVFDEIITGFRIAAGGAQEYFGVTPDIAAFGKAMAGGMQVSAIAGRAGVMDAISDGRVAHAGTFNSQPVAMAAAAAVLAVLDERREEIYPALHARGSRLMRGIRDAGERHGIPLLVTGPGSLFQVYLTNQPSVDDYRAFAACDRPRMTRLHELLLERGVHTVPRGLWFLSTEHTDDHVDETLRVIDEVFAVL